LDVAEVAGAAVAAAEVVEADAVAAVVEVEVEVEVVVDTEVESPEVEDAAAQLVVGREVGAAAEIDRPHYPHAAGTSAVAADQMSAVPAVSEIARAASVDRAAPAALQIVQEVSEEPEDPAVSVERDARESADRVASAESEALAIARESTIDRESEIGFRTPATDMIFGRTPTTTGITATGTAIGALGASARWHGV
jgi:hypothetical protein